MSKISIIFFGFFLACFPHVLHAQTWQSTDHVEGRILSAAKSVGTQTKIEAGLQIKLDMGWHTYWIHPGAAGLTPRFNWDNSENVADVKILWPAPKRFDEYGLSTFGYKEGVIWPLVVSLKEPKTETILDVTMNILICNDICIPQTLSLRREIAVGDGMASKEKELITSAKELLPKEKHPSLRIENVVVSSDALVVSAFSRKGFDHADVFAVAGDMAFTAKPKIRAKDGDQRQATIRLDKPEEIEDLNAFLNEKKLGVTLVSGKNATQQEIQF